ncbi:hypothetical protein P1P75_09875 [Streptomyces sp. ID05-39B]|uniref:hypothetical protein n=1 Tax=Streptomyces sp. ID05-39B TaxID=3028664 RepID=UPI0029A43174|nr:hypothetical protein [Streptomyces sp. ID05-39B]MDX3526744.1 hypothetical protein [Streptomyces sp. ID05-39B]
MTSSVGWGLAPPFPVLLVAVFLAAVPGLAVGRYVASCSWCRTPPSPAVCENEP